MGLLSDTQKQNIKDAADRIRKAVDQSVTSDDALTAAVDEYAALVTPLPIVGPYAKVVKTVVDGQDQAARVVKGIVDTADDEIDKL